MAVTCTLSTVVVSWDSDTQSYRVEFCSLGIFFICFSIFTYLFYNLTFRSIRTLTSVFRLFLFLFLFFLNSGSVLAKSSHPPGKNEEWRDQVMTGTYSYMEQRKHPLGTGTSTTTLECNLHDLEKLKVHTQHDPIIPLLRNTPKTSQTRSQGGMYKNT